METRSEMEMRTKMSGNAYNVKSGFLEAKIEMRTQMDGDGDEDGDRWRGR